MLIVVASVLIPFVLVQGEGKAQALREPGLWGNGGRLASRPSKAGEGEPWEEVPEPKRSKAVVSTELAAAGAEAHVEVDSTPAPEGGSESQTPGKVSLEVDTEEAAGVGASAVKKKAGSANEPVV